MSFAFGPAEMPGVVLIRSAVFADERGWFTESYRSSAFVDAGIGETFVQDNVSWSARRGTIRGLHFQRPPMAQGKLVRCLRGSVFDVVVDLRRGSPTQSRWLAFELSGSAGEMLWIPPGLAHGFQALSDDCLVTYRTTAEYSPAAEAGVRWDDPAIGIPWPIKAAIVSPRDTTLPPLASSIDVFSWVGR